MDYPNANPNPSPHPNPNPNPSPSPSPSPSPHPNPNPNSNPNKVGSVLSSWGPYTSTIGQVYKKNDLSLPAVSTKPADSTAGMPRTA